MTAAHVHRTDRRRILVVFFSRDGHTRRIAQEVAQACDADLDEIRAPGDRSGLLGYVRCALEALLGIEPTVQRAVHMPERYGLVVIGTPIWFWNIASPVRAWITRHRGQLPAVALFCTCGGSGGAKVFADLERLIGRPAAATLVLTEAQCDDAQHLERVRRFAAACERDPAAPGTGTPVEHPAA